MTLKNLILLTTTLCLGCSANANASSFSSGFYVGMGVGMERMNGQRSERMDTADPDIFEAQVFTNKQDMKKHGHLASLFGGYLHRWNHFGLGAEVFYEAGKHDSRGY